MRATSHVASLEVKKHMADVSRADGKAALGSNCVCALPLCFQAVGGGGCGVFFVMEIKIKQLDAGALPLLVLPIILFESFYKEPV